MKITKEDKQRVNDLYLETINDLLDVDIPFDIFTIYGEVKFFKSENNATKHVLENGTNRVYFSTEFAKASDGDIKNKLMDRLIHITPESEIGDNYEIFVSRVNANTNLSCNYYITCDEREAS